MLSKHPYSFIESWAHFHLFPQRMRLRHHLIIFYLRMKLNMFQPYLLELHFKSPLSYCCMCLCACACVDAAEWFFLESKSCQQSREQPSLGAVFITYNVERWDGGSLNSPQKCRHRDWKRCWVDIKHCLGFDNFKAKAYWLDFLTSSLPSLRSCFHSSKSYSWMETAPLTFALHEINIT